MDFTGKYRDKLKNSMPRQNLPHLKRIINNQVFLEETDPYTIDPMRRNSLAETGRQIMSPTGWEGGSAMLPSLGPQGESTRLFALPKNQLMPTGMMNYQSHAPTSYMTQGQYQNHPIFNS